MLDVDSEGFSLLEKLATLACVVTESSNDHSTMIIKPAASEGWRTWLRPVNPKSVVSCCTSFAMKRVPGSETAVQIP